MSLSCRWLFIVAFLLGTSMNLAVKVEPYSSEVKPKQNINLKQPEIASTFKRFEESAPTLIKLLQAICEVALTCLWVVDAILNACLWALNETVSSCTEFSVRIFGVLFNVVKLLEAFGFGVKFLLELNYAVLSYIFATVGCIKDSFSHAVTLVTITVANETEHMYESSSMALEGVQNLVITACNQTWVSVKYASSIVANHFSAPFGLSALDTSLVASMFLTGIKFFTESVVLTAEVFRDGSLFILNYIYDLFCSIGANVVDSIVTFFSFIQHTSTVVSYQIVYIVTWPYYLLTSLAANISCMLCYSWEAFVKWLGYVDSSVREIVFTLWRTIRQHISGLLYNFTIFMNTYFPGGIIGCIVLSCVATVVILWRKEISSLLFSSWTSLRRIHEVAEPNVNAQNDQQQFNNEDFAAQGRLDVLAQNTPEPPLDDEVPQIQTKLKHELELEKDKRLCVICQDNVKNILLLPCRHVCMCLQCLNEVRLGRVHALQCPLCRQHIQSTLEVFV